MTPTTTVDVLHLDLPLQVLSANKRQNGWMRSKRIKTERLTTLCVWLQAKGRPLRPDETAVITLTRVGPGTFDEHDNLPLSMKAVVDELAARLGLPTKDNSPRLRWVYEQARGKAREYRVLVRVEYFRP